MYKLGKGVKKDYSKAMNYFKIASEKGHVSSMYNLAVLYDFQADEEYRDVKKAIYYYEMAIEYGHSGAMNNLGVCYENGEGVSKDLKKALDLYIKASDAGDANGAMNASKCFRLSRGCEKDLDKSEFYCLRAKELEHKDADEQMKIIQEEKAKEKKSKKRGFFRR